MSSVFGVNRETKLRVYNVSKITTWEILDYFPFPDYMCKIYKTSKQSKQYCHYSSLKLFQPLRTKTLTQKSLSCLHHLFGI